MNRSFLKYIFYRLLVSVISIFKLIARYSFKRSEPHIVLVKIDHLGDFVLFSGVLKELSVHHRAESIILIANKALQEYIDECPYIKRAIYFDKKKQNNFFYLIQFLIKLPFINSKLVANFNYSRTIYSDLITYSFNAKNKSGFSTELSEDNTVSKISAAINIYTNTIENRNSIHELELHALFLNNLFKTSKYKEIIPVLWESKPERISENLHSLFQKAAGKKILICPDASFEQKFYGFDNFGKIIQSIKDQADDSVTLHFIVIGAKKIHYFEKLFEHEVNASFHNISGDTNLSELFYIIRNCDILIGNDSGPAHISLALKKMTFVVYGGGHYGRFFPYPSNNHFKGYIAGCNFYNCQWNCRMGIPVCVTDVPPEKVSFDVINYISKNEVHSN